jgi:hypothetical protein
MKRHLRILLASAFAFGSWGAAAQDAQSNAKADRREEPVRIQVSINLFFPGPTGESEEAVKLRDRVRRSVYEMAANECPLVEQVLAKTCRLESINVNLNRQAGQMEGYTAGGSFVLRVTLK